MSDVDNPVEGAQVAPAENTATPQEQTQAQAPESTTEQVDPKPQDDKPRDDKGRFVPQERVNEITRARREAERRAEALERELAAYRQQSAQHQPQQHEKFPVLSDYRTAEEWGMAVSEYSARQALSQAKQEFQQHDQQQRQAQIAQSLAEKEAAYAATTPDYMERVGEMAQAISFDQAVLEVFAASEHGPAVAYHLATHLDEADRISRLPPHLAAVQIGRLEALVSAPKPKPTTQAPAPVPTLGGSAAVNKDPAKMTYAEYRKWREGK